MRSRALALLATLLFAASLFALDDANRNRGFSPDGAFNVGDIDSVNLFNGNLIINVPIAPSYPTRGGASYSVHLVYTGIPWDLQMDTSGAYKPVPNRRSNAGFGWRVSMGKMYSPTDPTNPKFGCANETNCANVSWTYESPDGADHVFYLNNADSNYYTNDGTFLKMTASGGMQDVHFPDGMVHRFSSTDGTLREIRTPFELPWTSNPASVAISYLTGAAPVDSTSTSYWQISDGFRTSYVTFHTDTGMQVASGASQQLLSKIVVPTPSGYVSYSTAYSATGTTDDNVTVAIDRACGYPISTNAPNSYDYPFLRKLTLPDGSFYTFDYLNDASQVQTTCKQAALQKMMLPTGGSISYEYDSYFGVLDEARNNETPLFSPGVIRRIKTLAEDPTHPKVWSYTPGAGDIIPCIGVPCASPYHGETLEMSVTMQGPDDYNGPGTAPTVGAGSARSVSWFSTCRHSYGGYVTTEYGLPITHHAGTSRSSDDDQTRYLSTQFGPTPVNGAAYASMRTTYTAYDMDSALISTRSSDANRRVRASATVYNDDVMNNVPRVSFTKNTSYAGYGHYNTNTTGGTFTGQNVRTTFINHTPDTSTWLLDTFDKVQVTEGSTTFTKEYAFDSMGFLSRVRTWAGTARGAKDLLTVYTPDAYGNVDIERYYGGDCDSVAVPGCNGVVDTDPNLAFWAMPLPSSYSYAIKHTYANGLLATSQYLTSGGALVGFKFLNLTVDPTGFVMHSNDTADVVTGYTYDSADGLRVSSIASPTHATSYGYHIASTAGTFVPPYVTATVNPSADNVQTRYDYDSFGRMTTVTRDVAAGLSGEARQAKQKYEYDAIGRRTKVSMLEQVPAHFSVTAYDLFNRPLTITAPDGNQTTMTYTGASTMRRTVRIGASLAAATTTESYDRMGRVNSVTEPNGTVTQYTYDPADHLVDVCMNGPCTPSAGQERLFHYDGRGVLTDETHPENGVSRYFYDARSHVKRKYRTDAAAFDLIYTYDAAERIAEIDSLDPLGSQRVLKSFVYDTQSSGGHLGNGKITSATRHNYLSAGDYVVTEVYDYLAATDLEGRVTEKRTDITIPGQPVKSITQSQTFDRLGNIATMTYPVLAGTNPALWSSVTNSYDRGFLSNVTSFLGSAPTTLANLKYSVNGMPVQIDHGNGIRDTVAADPNGMQRPQSIQFGQFTCAISITSQSTSMYVTPGQPVTLGAYASGAEPITFQWYDAATQQPLAGANNVTYGPLSGTASSQYTTPAVNSTLQYFVRATAPCGHADSLTIVLTPCTPASIATQPAASPATVTSGTASSLSVGATGTALTYQWYQSPNGSTGWTPLGSASSSSSIGTGALTATTYYYVQITAVCGSPVTSNVVSVTVGSMPPTPVNVNAAMTGATQITVVWSAANGATSYKVYRRGKTSPGSYSLLASGISGTSYPDNAVDTASTYAYAVVAVNANGSSALSSPDLATTISYDPLTAITFASVNQMLTAVNAMYAASGHAAVTWSSIMAPFGVAAPVQYGTVYGAHIRALRDHMDLARQSFGFTAGSYTDILPNAQRITIKALHITELRGLTQ